MTHIICSVLLVLLSTEAWARDPMKHRDPEGYLTYAELEHNGNLARAYKAVWARLTPEQFIELNWRCQYSRTVAHYRADRARLADVATVPPEYRGPEGYATYAERFFSGDMNSAGNDVSCALSEEEWARLGWGNRYLGMPHVWRAERERLFFNGMPRPEYAGRAGYLRFADAYYRGKMDRAFSNASAVLGPVDFGRLGWGNVFPGTTTQHRAMHAFLFADGEDAAVVKWSGRGEYRGNTALARAYLYTQGVRPPCPAAMLNKARRQFSSLVTPAQAARLGWRVKTRRSCAADLG